MHFYFSKAVRKKESQLIKNLHSKYIQNDLIWRGDLLFLKLLKRKRERERYKSHDGRITSQKLKKYKIYHKLNLQLFYSCPQPKYQKNADKELKNIGLF